MKPYLHPLPDNVTMCPSTRELWKNPQPDETMLREFHEDLAQLEKDRTDSMVYLHIPFCASFCHFCYFTVFREPDYDHMKKYMDAMKTEIESYLDIPAVYEHPWSCIYFGGGTPSVVPVDMMAEFIDWLRETFPNGKNLKIEFEGEARSMKNKELLSALAERGCTRISIGTQTFDPDIRKMQNLKPTMKEIEEVCENTKAVGIKGLNFDLLYWLPGQTIKNIEFDVAKSIELGVTDIDYLITRPDAINKSDPYSKLLYAGKLPPMPTVDEVLAVRELFASEFIAAGYERQFGHFFSKVEKAQYHVNRYGGFDGNSHTLGIGVSARGSLGNYIYQNSTNLDEYYSSVGKTPKPHSVGFMTPKNRMQRIMFFFPRFMALSTEHLNRFDISVLEPYLPILESLENRGLILKSDDVGNEGGYILTDLGQMWYSNISGELIFGRERSADISAQYWDIPKSEIAVEINNRDRWDDRLPNV